MDGFPDTPLLPGLIILGAGIQLIVYTLYIRTELFNYSNMAHDVPADVLAQLLRRLVVSDERRTEARAPRAISSRTYNIGEHFPNFVSHFRECVKAAYGYTLPGNAAALDTACLNWIATKLEPGPTLEAFESLTAATKADWGLTVTALKEAFSDDAEKETFLADVASFKRGTKSLVHYKNELLRLMSTYLPDLMGVPAEFQRQCATRFIEGLADEELKRLLRRHCRRLKMTLDEAYTFTVDYESSELQTRIREGEGTAAFGRKTLGAMTDAIPKVVQRPQSATVGAAPAMGISNNAQQQLKEEMMGLAAKSKIAEMRIQELSAKNAHTNDRVDILAKEVGQTAVNVTKLEKSLDTRLDRIEQLLMANNSQPRTNSQQNQNNGLNQFSQGVRQNQSFRGNGNGNRGRQVVHASLTGGPGFVQNSARPNNYRFNNNNNSNFQRSAATNAPTPPSGGDAAVVAPGDLNAADNCDDGEDTEPKMPLGGSYWSPGLFESEIAGYEENGDNLSYGGSDFCRQ